MEQIKGYNIPFDISNLYLKTNLIEQDGPLLSLYYNDRGDYYLFYWVDCDDKNNRWVIGRTDPRSIQKYLMKETTLYNIICNLTDCFVWITDIDNDGRQTYTGAIGIKDLPEDYLPAKDSYFEFDNKEELLSNVTLDKYEVSVPNNEKGLFSTIASKMGWRLSPAIINFIGKAAL